MRNLFLFTAIAVVMSVVFVGCDESSSNTEWLKTSNSEVDDDVVVGDPRFNDLAYTYEDGGIDEEQDGFAINSDTRMYFEAAVSLKNDIISFVYKAKNIGTEHITDSIIQYGDIILLEYDVAIYKYNGNKFRLSQDDYEGFTISTINNGKFIEAMIGSDSFRFRNTSSEAGGYPSEEIYLTEKNVCNRIYIVDGNGTQTDSEMTFNKLRESTEMWKNLLK